MIVDFPEPLSPTKATEDPFSINKDNPLDGDLLIIDEFSMVDNILLSKLFYIYVI